MVVWVVARVFYVAARCFPPVWHEGSVSVIWSTVGSCWGVAMVFWVIVQVHEFTLFTVSVRNCSLNVAFMCLETEFTINYTTH